MRQMNAKGEDGKDNIIWFRPVGQTKLLAPLARRLMDERNINRSSSENEIIEALKPLKLIPNQLHHDLWRDFIIQQNPNTHKWNMVTNPPQLKLAYQILLWLTGVETLVQLSSMNSSKIGVQA